MRTFGIWVCGLLACGTLGGIAGSRVETGYSDDTLPGFFVGAFACLRLWFGQSSKISN